MDRFPAPKLTALLPDKPLRAVEPRLYECLTRELRRLNLHPYDVKAGGQASGQGVAVYVRYGERFDRLEGRFFFLGHGRKSRQANRRLYAPGGGTGEKKR
ncbi:hypothetical protein HMSSN036_46950 [Paenibacillus macerans]|nr:hypothetical protein HMSSN036_46950 [Paenibacillus macerans]